MNRRSFLAALLGTPALAALVAACGDNSARPLDTGSVPATDSTTPTTPTTTPTTTIPDGIRHPTGANDVVLRIGYEGGLVAPGYQFVRTPTLLISGDGRAFVPGVVPEVYPGPLLPALMERSIDEPGIQAVLAAAKRAGLLASPPDYSFPDGIGVADAPDTVVVINAEGATYTHVANGLDIDQVTSTPARDRLKAFVDLVSGLANVAGADHVGTEAPLVATAYRLQASPTDPSQFGDPKPTVVPWPAGTGLALADAAKCAEIDAAEVGTLFTAANQLTLFREGAVIYQLAVTAKLPGDAAC